MRSTLTFAIALSALFVSAPVMAQLGPKDGANLSATEIDRVKVGQPAPEFVLEAADGKVINLADFRGKKAVVLAFYRGYW